MWDRYAERCQKLAAISAAGSNEPAIRSLVQLIEQLEGDFKEYEVQANARLAKIEADMENVKIKIKDK